jgi:oligopeptidase B
VLDVELYAGHMVRLERTNALPAIIIRDLSARRHRLRRIT